MLQDFSPLSLVFGNFVMMSVSVVFFVFILFGDIGLWSWIYKFMFFKNLIWEIVSHYFFKYFFWYIPFLLLSLDSTYMSDLLLLSHRYLVLFLKNFSPLSSFEGYFLLFYDYLQAHEFLCHFCFVVEPCSEFLISDIMFFCLKFFCFGFFIK